MERLGESARERLVAAYRAIGATRIVLWGYVAPKHTHHWIMVAIERALKAAFRDEQDAPQVLWLDNRTVRSVKVFDDALVLGNVNVDGVDSGMPLRRSATYLLHDHAPGRQSLSRYDAHRAVGRAFFYEVFRGRPEADFTPVAGEPLHFEHRDGSRAVMLWGTDLLPDEIAENWRAVQALGPAGRIESVVFVGSSWHVNARELEQLAAASVERGLRFEHYGRLLTETKWPSSPLVQVHGSSIPIEDNVRYVREAGVAPALQGLGQMRNPAEVGNYVPCRLFKNISYGAAGLSNNASALDLYGDSVGYCDDIGGLLDAAVERRGLDPARSGVQEAMRTTAARHTYLNRLAVLFEQTQRALDRGGRGLADAAETSQLASGLQRAMHRLRLRRR